jgi:uncharacterized membrane protein YesL
MSKNEKNKVEENKIGEKIVEESTTADVAVEDTKKVVNYGEEEKVEKPTRAQRFFISIDKLGELFFLNIYFFITSIPIFTIGASFTALYTVTNKMVINKEKASVKDDYFKAFKDNFKQSTVIWIIDMIYIFLMYVQYMYILSSNDQLARFLYVLLGFEFIFAAFAIPLQFPFVARYSNSTFNIMRNALVYAVANLGTWFRMFFIWTFPAVLYYLRPKFLVYTWYLWGLFFTAFLAYICSIFLMKFYAKLEAPKDEKNT